MPQNHGSIWLSDDIKEDLFRFVHVRKRNYCHPEQVTQSKLLVSCKTFKTIVWNETNAIKIYIKICDLRHCAILSGSTLLKSYRPFSTKFELHIKRPFTIETVYFESGKSLSIHLGRVTHICAGELTSIGSDNGLGPGRRQAIIWSSGGIS